jgi:nitrate reductase gamma subunit
LFTGLCFFLNPDGEWALALINKNNGFTAFANDLLGLLIILGVLWAVLQRCVIKPDYVLSDKEDNLALLIIGLLVIFGFLLEGVRITMTGISTDIAVYSFMGYAVASALSVWELNWSSLYPYLWYAHGILGAVFVAYLPFGKMKHVINIPLTYFLEDVSGVKNEKRV